MLLADWLEYTVLTGVWGAVGQGARVAVGLKKMNDEAASRNATFAQMFDTARLSVSLFIGFIAGALAGLSMFETGIIKSLDADITVSTILGFMAAGYSGSDFIEGLVSRYLPSSAQVAAAPAAPAAPVPAAPPVQPGAQPGEAFHG